MKTDKELFEEYIMEKEVSHKKTYFSYGSPGLKTWLFEHFLAGLKKGREENSHDYLLTVNRKLVRSLDRLQNEAKEWRAERED